MLYRTVTSSMFARAIALVLTAVLISGAGAARGADSVATSSSDDGRLASLEALVASLTDRMADVERENAALRDILRRGWSSGTSNSGGGGGGGGDGSGSDGHDGEDQPWRLRARRLMGEVPVASDGQPLPGVSLTADEATNSMVCGGALHVVGDLLVTGRVFVANFSRVFAAPTTAPTTSQQPSAVPTPDPSAVPTPDPSSVPTAQGPYQHLVNTKRCYMYWYLLLHPTRPSMDGTPRQPSFVRSSNSLSLSRLQEQVFVHRPDERCIHQSSRNKSVHIRRD